MEALIPYLVFVHILSAAIIVGGWIAYFKTPTVTGWQHIAAWGTLLSGLLIVGVREMGDGGPLNHMKISIKLGIALIVLIAAIIARLKIRKGQPVSKGLAHAVGGMALINIAVAAIWV